MTVSSVNNLRKTKTPPLRSRLQYTTQTRIRIALFRFLPSDVRFQYSATGRHDTTTSDRMVSPYIRHFNTQLSACNFIDFTFVNYAVLTLYRVSQEECARLREGVPYVKVYRYNPKHLCPKLNGYGDNGQRSLKL